MKVRWLSVRGEMINVGRFLALTVTADPPIPNLPSPRPTFTMDPTLAPGYVPPNNIKIKASKGHHWAEVQKTKAKAAAESNKANGATTHSTSPSASGRPKTADSGRAQKQHPKMAIWRAGRSAVSDGEGIGGPADLEEVPIGLKRQALRLEDYTFPEHRLRPVLDGKPPPQTLPFLPRY